MVARRASRSSSVPPRLSAGPLFPEPSDMAIAVRVPSSLSGGSGSESMASSTTSLSTSPSSSSSSSTSNNSASSMDLRSLYNPAFESLVAKANVLPQIKFCIRAHNCAVAKMSEVYHLEDDAFIVEWWGDYVEAVKQSKALLGLTTRRPVLPYKYKEYGGHSVIAAIAAYLDPGRFGAYDAFCNSNHDAETMEFAEFLMSRIKACDDLLQLKMKMEGFGN